MFGLVGAKTGSQRNNKRKNFDFTHRKIRYQTPFFRFFADPEQSVPWRGPMASNAIKQLFNDADWGELDYLVVDLPPGTGDIHLTVCQNFPITGAIVVTTPQQVALADAIKGLGMFKMQGINIPYWA